jgi:hypothetical protein
VSREGKQVNQMRIENNLADFAFLAPEGQQVGRKLKLTFLSALGGAKELCNKSVA